MLNNRSLIVSWLCEITLLTFFYLFIFFFSFLELFFSTFFSLPFIYSSFYFADSSFFFFLSLLHLLWYEESKLRRDQLRWVRAREIRMIVSKKREWERDWLFCVSRVHFINLIWTWHESFNIFSPIFETPYKFFIFEWFENFENQIKVKTNDWKTLKT